jgi:hypothetical protein
VGAQEWFADTRYHNDLAIALMRGLPLDESATTALATLLGVATGGLTSVLATWLMHRTQARAQWLEQDTQATLGAHDLRSAPRRSIRLTKLVGIVFTVP